MGLVQIVQTGKRFRATMALLLKYLPDSAQLDVSSAEKARQKSEYMHSYCEDHLPNFHPFNRLT